MNPYKVLQKFSVCFLPLGVFLYYIVLKGLSIVVSGKLGSEGQAKKRRLSFIRLLRSDFSPQGEQDVLCDGKRERSIYVKLPIYLAVSETTGT